MSEMINFGIDLGTTNSLVAKFNKGVVEVFKNPNGFKETLPSVVAFRNDRILIGEQARRYVEKDPKNVVARFKRKMGTTESYKIKSLGHSKTPVELSAFVLKALKEFIHTGEQPEAVVITIPASFDMVQSNATKEAGHAAGFKQVVLLQEPIAASLAYSNNERSQDLKNSQWVVYDLGGGTFDVALVKIVEGDLKIVDHEGDNYLGGADFDALIVEKLVVPWLEKHGRFKELPAQLKSESGKYNRLWCQLLMLAEQAKIELSAKQSTEIEFAVVDDAGDSIEALISVTRSEYEALIRDEVDRTADMLKKILTRNSLRSPDLKFVLMVGGSTYTPFVRKRIEELLGIPVNTRIDPTNAIAVGAAYYAATKEIEVGEGSAKAPRLGSLSVKVAFNRTSQEREEIFSAKVEGNVAGRFYRITRADGGYDSGLKMLTPRISEDLPLQEDAYNLFSFRVYDESNNPVEADFETIQISQGKYSVVGQPLPEDLSLVVDDLDNKVDETAYDTKLDRLFAKNCVLPARVKKTVEVSKALVHDSDDEIRIIVVEGSAENHFTANKPVGHLAISGKQLKRDLLRGMEIDLTFELSESRDLQVQAYINPSGPEFSQIFTPTFRDLPVRQLADEVHILDARLQQEQAEAIANEKYEAAEDLNKLRGSVKDLRVEAMLLTEEDVTEDRYKIQDQKRRIAQDVSRLTSGKRLEKLRVDYRKAKEEALAVVNKGGNDKERRQLEEIVIQEHSFLTSTNSQKLEMAIDQLRTIVNQVNWRTPEVLVRWFEHLLGKREQFNDQLQARNLIETGRRHIAAGDFNGLAEVNQRLIHLLPQAEQVSKEMRHFTRIRRI